MALERPYAADLKTDCVDTVTAAGHNRQETQLSALTATVPITFSLPQIDMAAGEGVIVCDLDVPAGKKVAKIVMGIRETNTTGALPADPDLVARFEGDTNTVETDDPYEEFTFGTAEVAGNRILGSIENRDVSTRTVTGYITIFVEPV